MFIEKRKTGLIFVISFMLCMAHGQYSQYLFENIQNIPGLPSNRVICIAKDSLGYLWYGTTLGLSRSDGSRYEAFRYDPDDSSGIPAQHIRQIIVDKNNILWIRSADGLVFTYDAQKPKSKRFQKLDVERENDEKLIFQQMVYNGLDTIYAFERGGYVTGVSTETRVANEISFRNDMQESLTPSFINGGVFLMEKCWISSGRGLHSYDPRTKKLESISLQNIIGDRQMTSLGVGELAIFDKEQLIFSGTRRSSYFFGLSIYNLRNKKVSRLPMKSIGGKAFNSTNIVRIFRISDRRFFISSVGRAPIYYDFEQNLIDTFTLDWYGRNKLNTESIGCAYYEKDGRLIFGSNQGLFIHEPYSYVFQDYLPFEKERRFPNTICNAYNDPKRNKLVIGFQSGMLLEYDTATRVVTKEVNIPDNLYEKGQSRCPVMVPLSSDKLLIIAYGIYLLDLDSYKFLRLKSEPDKSTKESRLLYVVDSTPTYKDLIFMLERKLYRINLHTLDLTEIGDICLEDEKERPTSLLKDSRNKLWVTTNKNVLYKLEGENYQTQRRVVLPKYEDATINDALIDKEDKIWLAGYPYGLIRCKVAPIGHIEMETFGIREGLRSDSIISVIQDKEEVIWMSHRYGIAQFDQGTSQFVNYEKKHGINFPHNMNYGKAMDSSGQIYLSEGIGIIQFNPASLLKKQAPPPVYISEFTVMGMEPLSFWKDTALVLNWQQDNPTFTVSAINHTHSDMNQYKYMLEGLQDNWVNLRDNDRSVSFNSLRPGKYVFRAIASNHKGIWNTDGISISLTIRPPFWETWWFLAIVAIFIIGSVSLIFYTKVAQVRRQELLLIQKEIETQTEERKRIAQDLHDDIGAQLSAIKLYINARHKNQQAETDLKLKEDTEQLISKTIQDMRRIISDLSPQTLAAYGYEAALNELVYTLRKSTNIDISIDLQRFINDLNLNAQTALFRITQELFNNTVKHSGAQNSWFRLWSDEQGHHLVYRDDGRGLDQEGQSRGNGLNNIETRVKFLNGKFTLSGKKGEGIIFHLSFPRMQ